MIIKFNHKNKILLSNIIAHIIYIISLNSAKESLPSPLPSTLLKSSRKLSSEILYPNIRFKSSVSMYPFPSKSNILNTLSRFFSDYNFFLFTVAIKNSWKIMEERNFYLNNLLNHFYQHQFNQITLKILFRSFTNPFLPTNIHEWTHLLKFLRHHLHLTFKNIYVKYLLRLYSLDNWQYMYKLLITFSN